MLLEFELLLGALPAPLLSAMICLLLGVVSTTVFLTSDDPARLRGEGGVKYLDGTC